MNQVEFGRWVMATRAHAEAAVIALMDVRPDDPRVAATLDEAFARIWSARAVLGERPDRALRRMLVRLCRPADFPLWPAERPSNTPQWRERAARARSPVPHEQGHLSRRSVLVAAACVPVAAAVGGGVWWATHRPSPAAALIAIDGAHFTVRLTPDPAFGITRVARAVTTLGAGIPLTALPRVETESPHLATAVLAAGTPTATSLRVLVVHHPELVWADLHDAGLSSFVTDASQTFAAAENRLAGTDSSEVVWGDLGGRVHGVGVWAWAPFPGRDDRVLYVMGNRLVARATHRGVVLPEQTSHVLRWLPLNIDAELPIEVLALQFADGSEVIGVLWDLLPGTTHGEERVEWELGEVAISAPDQGGARFWHVPTVRDTFPELELQVDGSRRRFSVHR